ncbi:hypothetical protein ACLOJK_018819 [Asimina triloba]
MTPPMRPCPSDSPLPSPSAVAAPTVIILVKTHQRGVPHRAIQAIHHDHSIEPIPDPSRPQVDIDHNSHPRQARLLHRRRFHLHPPPVVAHFKSRLNHLLIYIFMDHSINFDLKSIITAATPIIFILSQFCRRFQRSHLLHHRRRQVPGSGHPGYPSHRRCEPVPTTIDCRIHRCHLRSHATASARRRLHHLVVRPTPPASIATARSKSPLHVSSTLARRRGCGTIIAAHTDG